LESLNPQWEGTQNIPNNLKVNPNQGDPKIKNGMVIPGNPEPVVNAKLSWETQANFKKNKVGPVN